MSAGIRPAAKALQRWHSDPAILRSGTDPISRPAPCRLIRGGTSMFTALPPSAVRTRSYRWDRMARREGRVRQPTSATTAPKQSDLDGFARGGYARVSPADRTGGKIKFVFRSGITSRSGGNAQIGSKPTASRNLSQAEFRALRAGFRARGLSACQELI